MNIENAPWLFAPALVYVFGIVALTLLEIANKTLIPEKWKNRAIFLGMMPLVILLLIAVLSMAAEMLYLFPDYANLQQGFKQLLDFAYGYNNNLLIMIPMGLFYIIVLTVSNNKNALFVNNQSNHNKCQMNADGDNIQAPDLTSVIHKREMDLERESEELKRQDDEWRDACAVDDNYWNNWSNP